MDTHILKFLTSWSCTEGGIHSTEELIAWIEDRNASVDVRIFKTEMEEGDFWFYDREEGTIHNRNHSFFSISGIRSRDDAGNVSEQPVILQQEIGYLGILCKEIGGVLHFLMQAKIEPGNVNQVQVSPTIQATKSNFTQMHGGKKPPYLEYFMNAEAYEVIVDQIQSEQSSRFYKKRNRNIIIDVGEEDVEVFPGHRWMTLGQMKQLMRIDNLVNMDTRTVLSCIPYGMWESSEEEKEEVKGLFKDAALFASMFRGTGENLLPGIYQYINDRKMFSEAMPELCPLEELRDWEISRAGISCSKSYPFQVVYCDISIEGREVTHWKQPLFEAMGEALFGLFTCVKDGVRLFLVSARQEIGCFDMIELAPSVQQEAGNLHTVHDSVTELFQRKCETGEGVKTDVILSEEGGRFYHEQNRNVIIEIDSMELECLPEGYFWVDFRTLNRMGQFNNCLNIQLRNLLSLLEV